MTAMADLEDRVAALGLVRRCYVDLDGTLLGPGGSLLTGPDGRPSARAARALVDAALAGLPVVPLSGRRRSQLAGDARLLGLPDWIAEAGSVTMRDGVATYAWGETPPGLATTPHDALLAAGALDALMTAFAGQVRPYEPWHHGREGSVLLHGRLDPAAADRVLAEAGCGWARVVDNGAAQGWPGREVRAYHLLARGVGKAEAVADDLAAVGVPREQAAAVGDSPADARVADVVGCYAQVAGGTGAHPAMVHTRGAMGDGVAEFIDALLRARRR